MNAPEPEEAVLLPEGVRKLEAKPDTKVKDCYTFVIQREDPTLANLLRSQLLEDPRVQFAGYKMPHPLLHQVELKVKTNGTVTPIECLNATVGELNAAFVKVDESFKREVAKKTSVDDDI